MTETLYSASRSARRMIRDLPSEERPRARIQRHGARALASTELLALITQLPDGLDTATEILSRHTLADLTRCSLAELEAIPGVGPATAAIIQAALELGRRAYASPPDPRKRVTRADDVFEMLGTEMMHLPHEEMRVICVDTRSQVLAVETVYQGTATSSLVRPAELFRLAMVHRSVGVIVVHNHPSGDPTPSPEDVHVTRALVQAGALLDIEVLDHVVIGQQRFVSLKERRLGFDN